MSRLPFSPHGSVLVDAEPGMLVVHMHGDWNTEMQTAVARQMRAYAAGLNAAGPWGIVNQMHDTLVYAPEIYEKTRASYAHRPAGSRLQAVAFVIASHVEGASLLRSRFERLLDGIIPSQVFADLPSARLWMHTQLHTPPHPGTPAPP
ncbi:hypothetical protein [Rhodoferax sp.]|uniref:hypothetical protein n=1 Tax=Rhodoferax sp. TaxID=50421 RepID=UPI0025EB9272|nr:hypothetical protein [Rhodoferax sp.]